MIENNAPCIQKRTNLIKCSPTVKISRKKTNAPFQYFVKTKIKSLIFTPFFGSFTKIQKKIVNLVYGNGILHKMNTLIFDQNLFSFTFSCVYELISEKNK